MRTTFLSVFLAVLMLVLALPADAQRGTGEPTGVGRQAEKPPVQALAGTVTDVKVGPCEMTTGRSATGAHLRVETEDDRVVDLHLGPLGAVEHVLEQVPVGQPIRFEAFRTDRMPEDAYVAKSLILDDKIIHLRDDNLRPSWAAGRGAGMGGGQGRGGGTGSGGCWWDNG